MSELNNDPHIRLAADRIRLVLGGSPVPEDAGHAENTLTWLMRLHPNADVALQLAALAHDIERARPDRLQRHQFADYDAFKQAHADVGAQITDQILADVGVPSKFRQKVSLLICRHETGGDVESDVLKDADSLSYFDHNLPLYYAREGYEETLRRARWGYERLSPRAQAVYPAIRHDFPDLNRLLLDARKPR